jgi:hypothetical protein
MASWRNRPWRTTDPSKTVGVPAHGTWQGSVIRSSNAIARLRRVNSEAAEAVELLRSKVGSNCPVHGKLEDPIITLLGEEIAFGCPDCSGEELRQMWAEEPIEE